MDADDSAVKKAATPSARAADDVVPIAVFVPGLFSTSAYFDLPGRTSPSLADAFRERGFHSVLIDPLGVGSRRVSTEELARVDYRARVADLLSELERVRRTTDGRVVLVGHSFGGSTIYGALCVAARRGLNDLLQRVGAVITIGSPAVLDAQRGAPWERLFAPEAQEIVEAFAPGGVLELHDFLFCQARISTRMLDRIIVSARTIEIALRLARRSPLVSALLHFGPRVPATFLYNRGDFTRVQFDRFLSREVLQRESARLMREILKWGDDGGRMFLDDDSGRIDVATEYVRLDLPTLTIASSDDALVRPQEVEALRGPRIKHARVEGVGHGGYLYKGIEPTWQVIGRFLDEQIGPSATHPGHALPRLPT